MLPELIAFFRTSFLDHQPQRYAVMQPQGADRKYNERDGQLTDQQITAHLAGRAAYAVPYVANDLAAVLALDIDAGGISAAASLLETAAARGLWAFATVDTSRNRGYVYVPFDELTNAARLHELGQQLIAAAQRPGYSIENRTHGADTRLPFARHQWNKRRGLLIQQSGQLADLDQPDEEYHRILARFMQVYTPNPTSALPPAPPAKPAPVVYIPDGDGITIARYNAEQPLLDLLEQYGAKAARGRGQKLYFCPFHADKHASLMIMRDGQHCKCMSKHSNCPLSERAHDAFSVFCVAERITAQQALRRLNGLPDDPEPNRGPTGNNNSSKSRPPHPRSSGIPPCGNEVMPDARSATQQAAQPAVAPTVNPFALWQTGQTAGLQAYIEAHGSKGVKSLHKARTKLGEDATNERVNAEIYHRTRHRYEVRHLRRLNAERRELIAQWKDANNQQTSAAPLPATAQQEALNATPPPGHFVHSGMHDMVLTHVAKRGGNPPAEPAAETSTETVVSAPVECQPDQDGMIYGPVGAIVCQDGAAYVPAGAEAWYNAMMQAQATQRLVEQPRAETDVSAPAQMPLDNTATRLPPEHERQQDAEKPTPRRRRATSKPPRFVTPGELVGRIVAATRKAEKLGRGNAAQRRQGRAIGYQVEQLERQLANLRAELDSSEAQAEDPPQATADSIQPAASSQPPISPEIAPPLGFLPGADARGLIARLRERNATLTV